MIRSRPHRRIWLAAQFVLTFALLALAVHMNRQPLHEALRARHDGRLLPLAFGLYLAGVLLAYLRWYLLVRAVGLPFQLRDAVRLGFIGTLFNFVIPGAIGGDFVRAAFLCRESGRHTESIASVVVDRLVGLLGLFGIALLAGTLGWSRLDSSVRGLITAAAIAFGITGLILVSGFLPKRTRPGLHRSGRTSQRGRLAVVRAAYGRRPGILPLGILMAGVTHTLNVLAFHVLGQTLFPSVPNLADHLLIVPLVLFSTAIPLPLGALGVTEQISAKLFALAHFPGGAVVMLAFRGLQFGGAFLGAGFFLANASQVRGLARDAEHLDENLEAEDPESVVAT